MGKTGLTGADEARIFHGVLKKCILQGSNVRFGFQSAESGVNAQDLKAMMRAIRRLIRAMEPGTLTGPALEIACYLKAFEGEKRWGPWCVPGKPPAILRLSKAELKELRAGVSPLRVWRIHRGMPLRELSEKSGISMTMICMMEKQKRGGRPRTFQALAAALDVEIDDLLPKEFGER